MIYRSVLCLAFLITLFPVSPGSAGEVEVIAATARKTGDTWTVSVTLKHDDTGWDHYADLWQVQAPDGRILGERVLLHPHVDEQPFTRLLTGLHIPDELETVVIRAHDKVHGFSPQTFRIALPVKGE